MIKAQNQWIKKIGEDYLGWDFWNLKEWEGLVDLGIKR